MTREVEVVDSHTGGEPTRVVIRGGPALIGSNLAEKRDDFRHRFDRYRTAIVCEPRGSESLVGALLRDPMEPNCETGAIFFNNVGYLGMCGHGTIGLVETLRYLGRIQPGPCRIDTPVGAVDATLHEDGAVSVRNVASYRYAAGVEAHVPGYGTIRGDVAYGGNWFFLVEQSPIPIEMKRCEELRSFCSAAMAALASAGITGREDAPIDHVELSGPSETADSRNFVLCPGHAFDRSPCGTGTSAKIACLAAEGRLQPGEMWRQESITGSIFDATYVPEGAAVRPTIRGRAHVVGVATLLMDDEDPLCWGLRS